MKNKILLHIPHSSKKLPQKFWQNVFVNKQVVYDFVNAITDIKTNKLFGANTYKKIIFKKSRVFCDVEKFDDNNLEVMSKFGMGVIYTHTNKGVEFAKINNEYKNYIIQNFYKPYHQKLDKLATKYLNSGKNVVFVDCHSFSDDIIMFENKKQNLPQICLGYNSNYNKPLINFVKQHFENSGYIVKENYPYDGTMVPNQVLKNKNKNFFSFMLEINKEVYLQNKKQFKILQNCINKLLVKLQHLTF